MPPHQALGRLVAKSGGRRIMRWTAEHRRKLVELAHVAHAIGRDGEKAAWLQHAMHLGDGLRRVLHMVEHVHGNDGVEGAGLEGRLAASASRPRTEPNGSAWQRHGSPAPEAISWQSRETSRSRRSCIAG
jgi:hypothetical protein